MKKNHYGYGEVVDCRRGDRQSALSAKYSHGNDSFGLSLDRETARSSIPYLSMAAVALGTVFMMEKFMDRR